MIGRLWRSEWGYVAAFAAALLLVAVIVLTRQAVQTHGHQQEKREANAAIHDSFARVLRDR